MAIGKPQLEDRFVALVVNLARCCEDKCFRAHFGFGLEQYKTERKEAVEFANMVVDEIEKDDKNTGIAKIAGGSAGIERL